MKAINSLENASTSTESINTTIDKVLIDKTGDAFNQSKSQFVQNKLSSTKFKKLLNQIISIGPAWRAPLTNKIFCFAKTFTGSVGMTKQRLFQQTLK